VHWKVVTQNFHASLLYSLTRWLLISIDHSNYTDARGSNFSDVHRDQIQYHNNITINFSLFSSRQTQTHNHIALDCSNDLSPSTSDADILSRRRPLIIASHDSHHSVDTASGSAIGTSIGLIIQITSLLTGRGNSSNSHRDLESELKSLQQTLTLTGLAVQEYETRPLGRSLAHAVTPEIGRCCAILQKLRDSANGTLLGLNCTSISDLWRSV
jgi:hypothetical protein